MPDKPDIHRLLSAAQAGGLLPITGYREIRPLRGARPGDRFAAAPVCGDALIEAHIIAGDWALFRLCQTANAGQLVIARTPEGCAIKYYWPQPQDGTVLLCGANDAYEDQSWPAGQVTIQGIVWRIERDLLHTS